jgi:hypothetical protein
MSASLPVLSPSVVTVPSAARVAAYSTSFYQVNQLLGNVRIPLFSGAGPYTSSTFASGAVVEFLGGDRAPMWYSVGTAAFIPEYSTQPTPGTLNATGTLTAALCFSGIVTSTTAAAVTATLDTGTIFDAASTFMVNDYVLWSVINTGGTNTFTVAASTGHTIVGNAVVALSSIGRFQTVKTAANTFVTYRVG